jgi:hypothetical protein
MPPVVVQEKVKSPGSRSSKVSREFIEFLKGVLVLGSKEQVDGFSVFWIGSSAHKIVAVGVLFSLWLED